jgi:hypothetical protein
VTSRERRRRDADVIAVFLGEGARKDAETYREQLEEGRLAA